MNEIIDHADKQTLPRGVPTGIHRWLSRRIIKHENEGERESADENEAEHEDENSWNSVLRRRLDRC